MSELGTKPTALALAIRQNWVRSYPNWSEARECKVIEKPCQQGLCIFQFAGNIGNLPEIEAFSRSLASLQEGVGAVNLGLCYQKIV